MHHRLRKNRFLRSRLGLMVRFEDAEVLEQEENDMATSRAIPILPPGNQDAERAPLPEYMPARMVNEFVYCPRLFFLEWVDGVFVESSDT